MSTLSSARSSLRVALEGCGHGMLHNIYASVKRSAELKGWDGVDLAVRNSYDLVCMSVPQKYKQIGDFHEYYSGKRTAPYLTIFIGGNHEASNHLFELYYGGWVAPNIYYLGAANVLRCGPLRIAGLSGIWKGYDYRKPHFERLPYNRDETQSIYHVRELDVRKLLQIRTQVDLGLSHDWPKGVEYFGDYEQLFRVKRGFREDSREGKLGSTAAKFVLDRLRPPYWFSAHLHVKFSASVQHGEYVPPDNGRPVNSDVVSREVNPQIHYPHGLDGSALTTLDDTLEGMNQNGSQSAGTTAAVDQTPATASDEQAKDNRDVPSGSAEHEDLHAESQPSIAQENAPSNPAVTEEHAASKPATLQENTAPEPASTEDTSAKPVITQENATPEPAISQENVQPAGDEVAVSSKPAVTQANVQPQTAPLRYAQPTNVGAQLSAWNNFHAVAAKEAAEDNARFMRELQERRNEPAAVSDLHHNLTWRKVDVGQDGVGRKVTGIERSGYDDEERESKKPKVEAASVSVKNADEIDIDMDSASDGEHPEKPTASEESNKVRSTPQTTSSSGIRSEFDDVPQDIRNQLPASFSRPTQSTHAPTEPAVYGPLPEAIFNKTTQFLALDKCLPNREFLELAEIPVFSEQPEGVQQERPFRLQYDKEWLAITRVFANDLKLGDASAKVPADKGDAYYKPLILEAEKWIEEHVVKPGKLIIPENFTPTAPFYDPSVPIHTNEMPPEYNNPQTAQFCLNSAIEVVLAASLVVVVAVVLPEEAGEVVVEWDVAADADADGEMGFFLVLRLLDLARTSNGASSLRPFSFLTFDLTDILPSTFRRDWKRIIPYFKRSLGRKP
ncbi:hypothetical protein VTN00DRAFT_3758 [Thermoascus crustaceus]|uniref:uncharacterized protein n=1 Tax=Thermoascus crustaceus TaxID=5088 RepID=UPI00374360A1